MGLLFHSFVCLFYLFLRLIKKSIYFSTEIAYKPPLWSNGNWRITACYKFCFRYSFSHVDQTFQGAQNTVICLAFFSYMDYWHSYWWNEIFLLYIEVYKCCFFTIKSLLVTVYICDLFIMEILKISVLSRILQWTFQFFSKQFSLAQPNRSLLSLLSCPWFHTFKIRYEHSPSSICVS